MTPPEPTTVTGAKLMLGELLGHERSRAGYSQHSFVGALAGEGVYLTRSSIANIERGRQRPGVDLCRAADKLCASNGEITKMYGQLEVLEAQLAARGRPARQADWRADDHHTALAPIAAVLHRTLGSGADTPTQLSTLESRVINAHQQRTGNQPPPLSLTLVGGFAGSGKSEFGRFLSSVTGWAHLDKDTITRPLVEQLLRSLGSDPDDRQSDTYQRQVRPVEYRCLMDAAIESLGCGVSTVMTAPFLRELADEKWLTRLHNNARSKGAEVAVIWVQADAETMLDYLTFRGAARDRWKMDNWQDYLETIDVDFRPPVPHYVVDNRLNATTTLVDQARSIAGSMGYAR